MRGQGHEARDLQETCLGREPEACVTVPCVQCGGNCRRAESGPRALAVRGPSSVRAERAARHVAAAALAVSALTVLFHHFVRNVLEK